jgi:hypothetical protein
LQGIESSVDGVSGLTIDPAGNLYVATGPYNRVLRVDGTTGRVTTIFGTGAASSGGDYGPATSASTNSARAVTMDAANHLYVAEDSSIRAVWTAGTAVKTTATLAVSSGSGQSQYVDQLAAAPLSAALTDGAGTTLGNYHVKWSVVTPGAGIYATDTKTNGSGIASVQARPGLAIGNYTMQAAFSDIHGAAITGSPTSFVLTGNRPSAERSELHGAELGSSRRRAARRAWRGDPGADGPAMGRRRRLEQQRLHDRHHPASDLEDHSRGLRDGRRRYR